MLHGGADGVDISHGSRRHHSCAAAQRIRPSGAKPPMSEVLLLGDHVSKAEPPVLRHHTSRNLWKLAT